jgi:hypothetical protein
VTRVFSFADKVVLITASTWTPWKVGGGGEDHRGGGRNGLLKHEIKAMQQSGGCAILNMSSITSSITAAPANGLYATKGGVNGLTKAAAIEAGKDKISVNALAFAASTSPGA